MNHSTTFEEFEGSGNGAVRSADDFTFASWKELPELKRAATLRDMATVPVAERAIALGVLAAFSPVMLGVAMAVKITSPGGPVLYKQERVGVDRRRAGADARGEDAERRTRTTGYGKSFEIYKFRTMIPDAEKHSGPTWATASDPRITKIGRFLRLTRLDELPQLFNVVRGDMRLIGPRPERPYFVGKLSGEIPDYLLRLKVPPGITGLAQVEKEYDASIDDVRKKVKYDLLYVTNRSLKLDTKTLLRTIDVVFRGKGAK